MSNDRRSLKENIINIILWGFCAFVFIFVGVIVSFFYYRYYNRNLPETTPIVITPMAVREELYDEVYILGTLDLRSSINSKNALLSGVIVEVDRGGRLWFNTPRYPSTLRYVGLKEQSTARILGRGESNGKELLQMQVLQGSSFFEIIDPLRDGERFEIIIVQNGDIWSIPVYGTVFSIDVNDDESFTITFFEGEAGIFRNGEQEGYISTGLQVNIGKEGQFSKDEISDEYFNNLNDFEKNFLRFDNNTLFRENLNRIKSMAGEPIEREIAYQLDRLLINLVLNTETIKHTLDDRIVSLESDIYHKNIEIENFLKVINNFLDAQDSYIAMIGEIESALEVSIRVADGYQDQINRLNVTAESEEKLLQEMEQELEKQQQHESEIEELRKNELEYAAYIIQAEAEYARAIEEKNTIFMMLEAQRSSLITDLAVTMAERDYAVSRLEQEAASAALEIELAKVFLERQNIMARLEAERKNLIRDMSEEIKGREFIIERLEQRLADADGDDELFTLLLIDLDHQIEEKDIRIVNLGRTREALIEGLDREIEIQRENIEWLEAELERAVEEGDARAYIIQAELDRVKIERDNTIEKLEEEHEKHVDSINLEVDRRDEDIDRLESELADALATGDVRAATLKTQLDNATHERDAMIKQLETEQMAAIQRLEAEKNEALSRLESERDKLKSDLVNANANITRLESELTAAIAAGEVGNLDFKTIMEKEIAERDAVIMLQEADIQRLTSERDNLNTRAANLTKTSTEKDTLIAQHETEINRTKDFVNSYTGWHQQNSAWFHQYDTWHNQYASWRHQYGGSGWFGNNEWNENTVHTIPLPPAALLAPTHPPAPPSRN